MSNEYWKALTDEDRDRAFNSMPDMLEGFMKKWGWLHFAKAIEDICREKNAAPPQPNSEFIQAITDPENQPSQYGTVTLDFHLAKIAEWESLFERAMGSRLKGAAPPQPVAAEGIDYLEVLESADVHNGWIVAKNEGGFTVHLGMRQHETRATLKEAIDAAISTQESGK